MSFVGEIRMFAGNFAPRGWLLCDGSEVSSTTYDVLYGLIGTIYGGDATNFKLPDLRGRVALGSGLGPGLTERVEGQAGGAEFVTLNIQEIPTHSHEIASTPSVSNDFSVETSGSIKCSPNEGNTKDPSLGFPAKSSSIRGDDIYTNSETAASAKLNTQALELSSQLAGDVNVSVQSECGTAGSSESHINMQPWVCINFIIKVDGVYPPRN